MITVAARFSIKPGCTDLALARVQAVEQQARAEQPGTLVYFAHRVLNQYGQPTSVLQFYECYKDEAAVQAHVTSSSWLALITGWSDCFEGIPADLTVVALDRLSGFSREALVPSQRGVEPG